MTLRYDFINERSLKATRALIPFVTINFGAGGRTRTDTAFYGPRILSPVRLPFRHTGMLCCRQQTTKPGQGCARGWEEGNEG